MDKEQESVEALDKGEEPVAQGEPGPEVEPDTVPETGKKPSKEELRLLLEDARSKADEHWDQLVRARAEIDNLNKRHKRDLEKAYKFSLERFVNALIPVRDSMELGLEAARGEGADLDKFHEGAELTLKLLSDVMTKFEVEQVDPTGEPFNPELHQAMSVETREDLPPNTVATVVQKGYTLNGRLVRPAMVIVSQAASGKLDEKA
jgi:molecular chaperone GrpE